MTFSRMDNKSGNINSACAASTAANLSNNKFMKDYYNVVKHHLDDGLSEQIPRFPSMEELRTRAEQSFINSYGLHPTCMVYAPGCLTIAGKSTDPAESKSLSMAIQLVTLVVGNRSQGSNWCQARTLSDKIAGETALELRMNNQNLEISEEETSWIRYLKGAIRSFKARRAHVPAFQIVIASNLPIKRGLGSSSALVVAFYTFLEVITNTYRGNTIEKTLACHFAEKLAAGSCNVRIADILTSVLGAERKILAFDSRTSNVEQHDWTGMHVKFIFIELTNAEKSDSPKWLTDKTRCKIMTALNTKPRWRTHPVGSSMMELLFPQETLDMIKNMIDEDERIGKMMDAIRGEQWTELGKLLQRNHRSACKYLSFLPEDIERIVNTLKTIEGVFGACVTGYGASMVALVQTSKLKNFVSFMNRMKISQRYYIMESCKGASTIYKYEQHLHPSNTKYPTRRKLVIKYRHNDEDKYWIRL